MNIPLILFLGIQLLSFAAAGAILYQSRRVNASRLRMFDQLARANTRKMLREHSIIAVLYVLTTLLIVVTSSFVFFLLQS